MPKDSTQLLSLCFGILCHSTAFVAVDLAGRDWVLCGGAASRLCENVSSAGDVRSGSYIMIQGRPCRVESVSVSKTGKHGHSKTHIQAVDLQTGTKVEDL